MRVIAALGLLTLVAAKKPLKHKNRAPNVVVILADDLGWANVGFNRDDRLHNPEIATPNMDRLAIEEGVRLTRHYSHYICTPTRTSLMTGRLPVHVQMMNDDPEHLTSGAPQNMTFFAARLKESPLADYQTHMVGKYDAGMASMKHTPEARGFDSSLIYFSHMNDFWTKEYLHHPLKTSCTDNEEYGPYVDYWSDGAPAVDILDDTYEEQAFAERVTEVLNAEASRAKDNKDARFLLYLGAHTAHFPLQIPRVNYTFHFADDEMRCNAFTQNALAPNDPTYIKCRSAYTSMVQYLDNVVGGIESQLKELKLWKNTLIIFASDNGASLIIDADAGNNYPLKGGKFSSYEGGIRTAAFVSGGFLPKRQHGKTIDGLIHVTDWYSTILHLADVDPEDERAAAVGLPPIDSMNVWPLLSGRFPISPRQSIHVDPYTIMTREWKLIMNPQMLFALWTGPVYPNATSADDMPHLVVEDCSEGCLYNLIDDPTEHKNLINEKPAIALAMKLLLLESSKSIFQNSDVIPLDCPATVDAADCMCWMADNYWVGFIGPYAGGLPPKVTNNVMDA
jgi:arylsulfatase I/J